MDELVLVAAEALVEGDGIVEGGVLSGVVQRVRMTAAGVVLVVCDTVTMAMRPDSLALVRESVGMAG